MRNVVIAVLVITASLACFYAWNLWVMFGTPARALETMISAGSGSEGMRCYSRKSLALMKRIRRGGERDCFRFGMLAGGGPVDIISEEISGPEAWLSVKLGDGPPYKLRFVREGLTWKFDISDKLSAALKGMEK